MMGLLQKHWSVIVIGTGQAGVQVVQSLREYDYKGSILMIGKDNDLPYQRPPLSKDFLYEDVDRETLFFQEQSFYEKKDITCLLGNPVLCVDAKGRCVFCQDGRSFSCDFLVIATGGEATYPPIPGLHLSGVETLRYVEDALHIKALLQSKKSLMVMGGGYIGLEVTASARKLGCDVSLVEREDRLMKRIATPSISSFFLHLHHHYGVKIMMNAHVTSLEGIDGFLQSMILNGTQKKVDSFLLACGLKPSFPSCLQQWPVGITSGLMINTKGEVKGYDGVFACGDISEQKDTHGDPFRIESVQNAIYQGKKVAATIAEKQAPPYEHPWFWSRQYDTILRVVGLSKGADRTIQRGVINQSNPNKSQLCVFSLKKGRIIAVESVNHGASFMLARRHIGRTGMKVDVDALANEDIPLKKVLNGGI